MSPPLRPDEELRVVVVSCAEPFPTAGWYVSRFYLSQLGPTSTALLQLLAADGSRSWRAGDLAGRLGIGGKKENHAHNPLGRSLDRLTKFRLVEWVDDGRLFVRSHVARLEAHQVARMTDELRAEHAAYMAAWEASGSLAEAKP